VHREFNEDLFESTKMTFGEHLDELRRALVYSVVALAIGFCAALGFAGYVVDYVQTPLKTSLEEYYLRMAKQEYLDRLMAGVEPGTAMPKDVEAAVEIFAKLGLIAEEKLIDPQEIDSALKQASPSDAGTTPPVTPQPERLVNEQNLVPIRFYHHVKDDPRVRIVGLGIQEPFVVYMKVALVLGILIASPFIFYFIWNFVAVGLYPHEKKYVNIFLPFSLGLFLAGAALAYFVVFRFVLAFLLTFYEWMRIDPDLRITDWLTFVLIVPLGFGISFQLPLVMLFLERIGIMTVATYLSNWRISVLVICFVAMVLTPSDPYSMMLMAMPLVLLYFFGIMLCKWMPRRTTPFGEALG
jgi:sec-independent protein translocase protein TatC